MQINLEQLEALAKHAKVIGTQDNFIDLALGWAKGADDKIGRLSVLLEETRGWLGPHDYNPVELVERVTKELTNK